MTPAKRHKADEPATPTGAGLWIRVAANLVDRKVVWRLVELIRAEHAASRSLAGELPLDLLRAAAEGYLVNLWGRIAEHTAEGRIAEIPHAQLEHWAGWAGTPGAFARWVFEWHYDDEKGKVREWDEYAGALATRRASDAERQRAKRERDRRAAGIAAAGARAREQGTPREQPPAREQAPAGPAAPVNDPADQKTAIALQLTIAANKGMEENPAISGRYNPIAAGRGDALGVVDALAAEGVTDWNVLARIVYTIAKSYEPAKPGDSIRSLTFFRYSAATAWQAHVERARAAAAPALSEVSIDRPPVSGDRRRNNVNVNSPGARARSSATGALAAGRSVGLPSALETVETVDDSEGGP